MTMSQHTLILEPTDVLFFKDGRPMEGASMGHGAAWPMPNVFDSALHHALRRAQLDGVHRHRAARNGEPLSEGRDQHGREFGSLQTAGPYPVHNDRWFFPRPADADSPSDATTTHKPLTSSITGAADSLNGSLFPVVNSRPPGKNRPEPWISAEAYTAYLGSKEFTEETEGEVEKKHFLEDKSLFGAEHNIGIGIDPTTGTQDGQRFYSASYLRLRRGVRLGLVASCMDKGNEEAGASRDLIATAFQNSRNSTTILAGGQQRTCNVLRHTPEKLPFPKGPVIAGTRVRWTLLSPSIFPALTQSHQHPGGWLPSWINPDDLSVQLKAPAESTRSPSEGRKRWRSRVADLPPIRANLIAASIPRALPVTGWALHDINENTLAFDAPGGARATHLAVPAGAVYYFEADDVEEAKKLAEALNWHGSSAGTEIRNRRSTLFGEKGYGLGVCSAWESHATND